MDGKGIFHLERVQKFFNLMKIKLDDVQVHGLFFDFYFDGVYDENYAFDFESAERKC